jgi:hypothetical protein
MQTGMLHLHSFLRWVILLLALIAIFRAVSGMLGKKPFTSADRKVGLFLMIFSDTMLLIGLYLWAFGDRGLKMIQSVGMGGVMKDPVLRFYAIEHFISMLIALALVHIGKGVAKKNISDQAKHKRTLLFFGLALLVMLISIPWPFREVGAGRNWF